MRLLWEQEVLGSNPSAPTKLRGLVDDTATPQRPAVSIDPTLMTPSCINKLGQRLRKVTIPDEKLLEELQAFRARFVEPLNEAHEIVRSALGVEPTSRIKTVNTIVEKLVRDKTRLSKMQDIAGVRVVLDADADLSEGAGRGCRKTGPSVRKQSG